MSLINNMLKDIEYREKQHPHLSYSPYNRTPKGKITLNVLLKSAIFVFAFMTVTMLLYFLFFKKQVTPSIPFITEVSTVTTNTNTIDPSWKRPVQISGITIQNKDNITELTFLLEKNALYRLVTDEMQNQLIVYIDRAKLKAALPAANSLGKAITRMNSEETNDETKFTISLAEGSTVKYVNQNTVNNQPELVIAIRAAIPTEIKDEAATFIDSNNVKSNDAIKAPTSQNLLNQQYQAALINAEHGNFQLAVQNLNALLKMDPEYKDARVSLVALLLDQGKPQEALELVKIGLDQSPDFVPFIELKARIYAVTGKQKQALNILLSHAPAIETNPEYHAFIAAMYEQNNQYNLAVNIYRHLVNINENNSSWWFGLGVSLDKLNDEKNALLAYKNAAKNGHLNQESSSFLQERLQKLQEAIDDKK